MLPQLLPGIREFRTPFASGLLWTMLGWALLGQHITRDSNPALFKSFHSLDSALKPLGVGLSLTLGAYLVGAAFEAIWGPAFASLPNLSSSGKRSIYHVVMRCLDKLPEEEVSILARCRSFTAVSKPGRLTRVAPRRGWSSDAAQASWAVAEDLIAGVESELDVVGTRLLSAHRELFNTYDRLKSEAEFRIAIAVPLSALIVVLGREVFSLWVVVPISIVVFFLFMAEAITKKMAAGDRIVDVLVSGSVVPPSLDDITPGRYTKDALEEGRIRPVDPDRPAPYQVLGIPWRVRLVSVLSEAVDTAFEAASDAGRAFVRVFATPLLPIIRAIRRTADAVLFAARDLMRTRGTVLRRRRDIMRKSRGEEGMLELAQLYRDYGYLQHALDLYEKLGTQESISLRADAAMEAAEEGLAVRSLNALEKVLTKYVDAGQEERAERLCRRAIADGLVGAYSFLGDLARMRGDVAAAEQAYRTAASHGLASALDHLGDMRLDIGDVAGARAAYGEAVENGWSSSAPKLEDLVETAGEQLAPLQGTGSDSR